MPASEELRPLICDPREEIGVEYKDWLDLGSNHGRATIARAAIALVNHGGGFIVIGFREQGNALVSHPKPNSLAPITQDNVNAAVRRFAAPEFHVEVYRMAHPATNVEHVIVSVPSGQTVPVMSKRDCEGVIAQNRCYIRKPGPRSEEPLSQEEWRTLLNRCVRAQREDMLDAIRTIVTGRVEVTTTATNAGTEFSNFINTARQRWAEVVAELPADRPARFPHGSYEMAFGLVGAEPCATLADLQDRLATARRIKLTGWSAFLQMSVPGLAPYPNEDFVEAWLGRPVRGDELTRDPSLCDFWRASRDGRLYTIRGYSEDGLQNRVPGTCFDVSLPIWRVSEGLLFASRLAETFEGVEQILIRCRYTGLRNRELTSITGSRWMLDGSVSQSNEIILSAQVTLAQIRDNLTEILHNLLVPLYERFDFFRLPVGLVAEENHQLQQRRF